MISISYIINLPGTGTFEVKSRASAKLRKKIKRARELRRRRELEKRTSEWSRSVEMTGGASGLIGAAGAPLLRLLAEESRLRSGLSTTLARSKFVPGHDRGQVLVDVAVALALGATSVAGAIGIMNQARALTGPLA